MKLIIPILSLMTGLVALAEEEPPQLPPNLDQVKTGAYWEEGQKHGFVRFCTFERGYEHVRHQIVIEWTQSPNDPDDQLSVLSRMVVKEIPDVWSVGEAEFVHKGKKRFIEFSATNTYSLKEAKFSIELLGVGKIAVTKHQEAKQDGADPPAIPEAPKPKIIEVDEKPAGKILKVDNNVIHVEFTNHKPSTIKVGLIDCILQKKEGDAWVDMRSAFRDARVIPSEKLKTHEVIDSGATRNIEFLPASNHHLRAWKKGDTIRLMIGYRHHKNGERVGEPGLAHTVPYGTEKDAAESLR